MTRELRDPKPALGYAARSAQHSQPLCYRIPKAPRRPAQPTRHAARRGLLRQGVVMATVQITHQWTDGSATQVRIRVDESFPDCVAEAKANAVAAMRDVLGIFEAETEA